MNSYFRNNLSRSRLGHKSSLEVFALISTQFLPSDEYWCSTKCTCKQLEYKHRHSRISVSSCGEGSPKQPCSFVFLRFHSITHLLGIWIRGVWLSFFCISFHPASFSARAFSAKKVWAKKKKKTIKSQQSDSSAKYSVSSDKLSTQHLMCIFGLLWDGQG